MSIHLPAAGLPAWQIEHLPIDQNLHSSPFSYPTRQRQGRSGLEKGQEHPEQIESTLDMHQSQHPGHRRT
jgi:hypothetical protein